MLQLTNDTPFAPSFAVLPDAQGIDTLHTVLKGTVTLRPSIALADPQVPPVQADEYYGDPALSSLKAASELHIGKPGTDVLLVGSAWAPESREVPRSQVILEVAGRRKTLLISGDRVWHRGRPSAPVPFVSMPLVWERAFGGFHRVGDRVLAEERNPVGCGFAGGRSPEAMEGLPVPNIEDVASPLQQVGDSPGPAGLAPISASWLPRRQFAGTYDEVWQRTRAPFLPDDFDPRFLQCAPGEFAFERYLQPGEAVRAWGVMPDGPIQFTVPDARLDVSVTIAGTEEHPAVNLETLLIEPDQNRVCFTWRAVQPCDRRALKVERIVIRRRSA